MRWNAVADKMPQKDGVYWVYPYCSLDGHKLVKLEAFKNGHWKNSTRPQDYSYWKSIEIPHPPKLTRDEKRAEKSLE